MHCGLADDSFRPATKQHMPLIQIELTPDEDKRLDKIAKDQKRAKRQQAHVLIVERIAEIEAASALKKQREMEAYEYLSSLSHPPKPRFFRTPESCTTWRWDGRQMLNSLDEESLFSSPDDLMSCLDVFEVDEWGNPISDDPDDVAGARGDYEGKLQKEQEP